MTTRTCRECGQPKTVEELSKRMSGKPTNICKPCVNELSKQYREWRKQKMRAQEAA